ncbi:MAG: hypothetical protein ABI356_14120 [Steroidobacteraceae bacterium]
MSSGILKDEHKERTTRLLTAFQARADADQKGLPTLDAAASNPTSARACSSCGIYTQT